MKPLDEKNYTDVIVPKIWEAIIVEEDGKQVQEHVLVNKKTSDYIRFLESKVEELKKDVNDGYNLVTGLYEPHQVKEYYKPVVTEFIERIKAKRKP